jgi:hypothetical protein
MIQWDCYSSCVLVVLPGEDQCVCKSAIAPYLNVIERDCNQGANKSNIRTRIRHFRHAYHSTRNNNNNNNSNNNNNIVISSNNTNSYKAFSPRDYRWLNCRRWPARQVTHVRTECVDIFLPPYGLSFSIVLMNRTAGSYYEDRTLNLSKRHMSPRHVHSTLPDATIAREQCLHGPVLSDCHRGGG